MTTNVLICITFYPYGHQMKQLFLKEVKIVMKCDQMTFVRTFFYEKPSLDCDKMTGLWPNDCTIFTFYYILFIITLNLTILYKKVVELDDNFRLWWNDFSWPNDCKIFTFNILNPQGHQIKQLL